MPRIKWSDWKVSYRYTDTGEVCERTVRAIGAESASWYVDDAVNYVCAPTSENLVGAPRQAEVLMIERVSA